MVEKKASEILDEVSSKTDTILKYQTNNDLTQKLILSKFDKIDILNLFSKIEKSFEESFKKIEDKLDLIEAKLSNKILPSISIPEEVIKPKLPPGPPKSQLALEIEKLNRLEREEIDEEEEINFIDVDNSNFKNKKDGRFVLNQERLIPIQQKILYHDDKVVCLAKVEIFDLSGRLVKQTKTNQTGKWLSSLPVGRYKVNVLKSGTSTKPKIEFEYEINVPNSDSAIELETKK